MAKSKKREKAKYPGLDKHLFSKIKQEYHDLDYVNKLNDEEKKWMSQFMEEHLGANVNPEYHQRKYNKDVLHQGLDERRKCFGPNNSRIRDAYSNHKVTGTLYDETALSEDAYDPTDDIIESIDLNRDFYLWDEGGD